MTWLLIPVSALLPINLVPGGRSTSLQVRRTNPKERKAEGCDKQAREQRKRFEKPRYQRRRTSHFGEGDALLLGIVHLLLPQASGVSTA